MSGLSFADTYKAAGFSPGPEIVRLRQEAVEAIRKDLKATQVIDAVRLYFGLPAPSAAGWFRDGFARTDPSFTMVDNAREVAVLSACLLSAEIDGGNVAACFAPLTASAVKARTPVVQPDVIDHARETLHLRAVSSRASTPQHSTSTAKLDEAAEALAQGGEWPKAAALFKQLAAESNAKSIRLTQQLNAVKEEVEILWWHVGGWSRILNQPFSELAPGAAALMAGIDLSDLTTSAIGPAAAPAILFRLVSAGREKQSASVTIAAAIDGLSPESLNSVSLPQVLSGFVDVCPVLGALTKAATIGAGWPEKFKDASGLDAAVTFDPADLALQVFRERQLLAQLE